MHTIFPISYAGFEVGSGFSGLKIIPANGLPLAQDLATLASFLADGDLTTWLNVSIILLCGRKLDNEVGSNTVKRVDKRLLLLIARTLVPPC